MIYKFRYFIFFLVITTSFILIAFINKPHQVKPNSYVSYTVAPGETLWSIAEQYTPSEEDPRELIYEIRELNDITPVIHPGDEIIIPIY